MYSAIPNTGGGCSSLFILLINYYLRLEIERGKTMAPGENGISRRKFLAGSAALSSLPLIASCSGSAKLPLESNVTSTDPNNPAGKSSAAGMPMRMLGKTGMSVSVLGFGCGSQFSVLTEGNWQKALDAAIAGGINYFDCASDYGTSPRLATYFTPSIRSNYYIATKLQARDYAGAKTEFQANLKDLKMDYVDVLCTHALVSTDDVTLIKNGVWKYFLECKAAGTAKFIGFSSMNSAPMSKTMLTTAGISPDMCILALNAGLKGTAYPPAAFLAANGPLVAANAANVGVCAIKVLKDMVPANSAETLMAYMLNLKDASNKPAIATMLIGHAGGAAEVNTNVALVKKIVGNTGVLEQAYDFDALERRASRLTNPQTMCWMRPDYKDNGKDYIWS
jgi:diketogulonate reductase-like aldo/keto reductase